MKEILMIFIGGGLGSVMRYLISLFIGKGYSIAYHTLAVNIIGSLFIGVIMSLLSKNPTHILVYLLAIGFCGGFTTFSTFSLELLYLFKAGNIFTAFLYISISIGFSLLAVILGYYLGNIIK